MPKNSIKVLSILILLIFNGYLYAQEIKVQDSLTKALFLENNPHKRMDILIELTEATILSEPDRALDYANQTIHLATESDHPKYKLLAWLQLGDIYWNKSNYRSSLEYGNMAKALALDMDLDKEYAESLILIARNFSNLGDFEKSAVLNFQALGIFEELSDKRGIGEAFNSIGFDYFDQGFHDKALEYYTQSLEISREIKDLYGISRGLNNVAIVYADKGESLLAKTKFKESIEINKILDRQSWVGINYLNLGTLYRLEKNYDTAFYYLISSVHIITQLNNRQKLSDIYYGLSFYYLDLGKLDSSIYYANQTYQISLKNNQKSKVHKAAKQLTELYHQQHDFEKAYTYSRIESQLKDSLATEISMARISHLELLYEYEKAEQENKIAQQRREYILIFIGAAIVFILLALVVIIIIRNRLKAKNEEIERRRLNLELGIRNKELASNVMTLIRKNEILSGIGDKLMNIQNNAVKEETKFAIKKIARELQQSTDNEIWDEFEVRFNQVHGEFYDELQRQFPDLSPNEKRLCAFLRLNMSTKEISELTGQRIDTLEIARWRLRKKLKITNTKTNLVTFLSKI